MANSADRRYEMMFIIKESTTEKDRESLLKEIRSYVAETGAKIFHEDDWGLRKLAYTIKGMDAGYYHIFYFEDAQSEMMAELSQNMRLNQNIVRHMTTIIPADYQILPMEELAGASE